MQIRKIRFENIHSLKGEHEIDFGDGVLGEAGLFAIIGPTGSGKSTLLDVITLALYNRIARVEAKGFNKNIVENDGSLMTRNMKSCFAEVEYRVKGVDYRSHWSIERNRNDNLNSRKQELVEVASGKILESGTKTPDRNAVVIGLSYDQFVKSMVLSQGDFSKLLQAPRDERNKLLEDITGARSYREIGKAVYRRFSELKKAVELKQAGLETIELLSEELIAEKKSELEALNTSKPETHKNYQDFVGKIATRKELREKLKDKEKLREDQEKLKVYYTDFEVSRKKLLQHEKLVKYSGSLRQYDQALTLVKQAEVEIKKLTVKKLENEEALAENVQMASQLVREEVDRSTAHKKLQAFRLAVSQLQTEELSKGREATFYRDQFNLQVGKIADAGYTLAKATNPDAARRDVNDLAQKLSGEVRQSGLESLEELNRRAKEIQFSIELAVVLLPKKERETRLVLEIAKLNSELETVQKALKTSRERVPLLEKEITSLEIELEKLETAREQRRKHMALEDYRIELIPHEPCPLCGALDHPYVVDHPIFDTKEELLTDTKNLLKIKNELRAQTVEKINNEVEKIINMESELGAQRSELEGIILEMKEASKDLGWAADESLEEWQKKRAQLMENSRTLALLEIVFQTEKLVKAAGEILNKWELVQKEFEQVKAEREAMYMGKDISREVDHLTTSLTKQAAENMAIKNQLLEWQNQLSARQAEKAETSSTLQEILKKEQLETLETLRNAILTEDDAGSYRKRSNDLDNAKTRVSVREEALRKALESLQKADDGSLSDEDLQTTFQEAESKWSSLSESIGKITQSLEDDRKTRQKQQSLLAELNQIRKDLGLWKTMNDLIGDAHGKRFSNFVQDLTLEQLIGYANKRLSEFSDRYVLDIPTADEAEKSDTLKIFDKYMGNARRSVRTLSGGETFLVSLAMAFALSDIASRNVKIESLFIDEGFGTLDPETLDQAITILEKMQNEGDKTVGIISHVGALKERITTQIQLEKGSLGYSTIRVVQ